MNTNLINLLSILISSISYALVILLVFRLLRVNYYNPIVKSLVKILNPLSVAFTSLMGGLLGIFAAALLFKFLSFYMITGSTYELYDLFVYAA